MSRTTEEINALLAKPYHAVVGVNRASGSPQLSVTWFVWDGKVLFFSTTKDRAKYRNLKRDPAISMVIDDREHGWYVAVYGKAEIIEHNHDELAIPLVEKYMTAEQRAQSAWGDPSRVIVVVHPEKILTGS